MEMKYNLSEVSFIRPLLIILVVLYHAFAPFTGTWREFVGFVPNEAYRYIADISYSSMLETFVPIVVGPYLLPWVGFGIALLVSTFMTYLVRLSLIGKRLL